MLLFLLTQAFAVPLQVNQQGRLLDADGKGLTGDHELTFRLMNDPDDGFPQWEDTLTVDFTNGYYSVVLGADEENNPLDDAVFSQYPLFLELKVDGEALEPRQPITSVPYAQMAGVAEVAESVDGGSVNASEISINGTPVVNADGQWVGEEPTVDFMNLQNRPPGLDDGDDDTQLTQTEVVDYVSGSQVNLGADSQVDGSDIVTANGFAGYLPADLADGDADTLAGINCATGEILSWDGNSNWMCTSDATLEWADVEDMLVNNPVDLNATTTIGGNTIITSIDDSDTLMSLSCGNGEVAKYDDSLMEWYCDIDIDTDTVLSDTEVLGFVNGQALSLASGTQVDGSDVVTVDSFASNLPADLADGDADTLAGLGCGAGEIPSWDGSSSWVCTSDATLDETTVEGYITNADINLYAGSQVDGNVILTTDSQLDFNKLDNVPSDLTDGDDDTQLSESDVEAYVSNDAIDLHQDTTIGGVAISDMGGGIESTGAIAIAKQDTHTISTSSSIPTYMMQVYINDNGSWNMQDTQKGCTNCGNGTDGDFAPTTDTTLSSGTYNYESFTIPSGVTVTVTGSVPLIIKSATSIVIEGELSAPGQNAGGTSGGTGGPGGDDGANGTCTNYNDFHNGSGGSTNSSWSSCSNASFSISGGNGGIGGKANNCGGGGGGGGGAIVLSSRYINITGTIDVSGGDGAFHDAHYWNGGEWGGGGSGGSVWISATGLDFTGTINKTGGMMNNSVSGGSGYVHVDALSIAGTLTETCRFDAFPYSYRAGFSKILESSFSNGDIILQNNGVTDIDVVANVQQ